MSHEHERTPSVPDDAPKTKRNPILIVVMGVAGTGKTTLALALQARLGMPYIEGDALHPPENIAKMSAGTPLTDADREPWLELIRTTAERLAFPPYPSPSPSPSDSHSDPDPNAKYTDVPGVLATCSALRGYYRDILRGTHVPPGLPVDPNANGNGNGHANGIANANGARGGGLPAYFVYIKGSRAVIWGRISAREGHYMKPGMLDSQFAALESPEGEEGVVVVPLEASTEEQADIAIRELNKLLPEPLEPLSTSKA